MTEPDAPKLDVAALDDLLTRVQSGVVSRRQVLELGGTDNDIERMLRRRELVAVRPGIYVSHTGEPTRTQREWAAVLFFWPAALTRESALPKPDRTGPIHVAIALRRNRQAVSDVQVHRTADFEARVSWVKSPPRMAYEHAVIDVATSAEDRFEAYRVIADACQTRKTTAAHLASTLRSRPRVAGKKFLLELLEDLAVGACSVLEREWLQVQRRHGLPEGNRQVPDVVRERRVYRDVDHPEFGPLIELDGKPFHDTASARDRDHARDLEAAVTRSAATVRLTYGQVLRDGCTTARHVATLLERGGWPGPFVTCPDCPEP